MRRARALLAASAAVVVAASLGAPAQATYPGDPGSVAFGATVDGNVDVYSARADGSEVRRLTEDPGFDACVAYDATGDRVAFCSTRTGPGTEIWTMRSDGTQEHRLTRLNGAAAFPDFAPRRPWVAFSFSELPAPPATPVFDIWIIRDDGRRLRQLTDTPDVDESYPVWSPDGRWIAFIRADRNRQNGQLWVMDRNGRRQRQLTFDPLTKEQLPDWRPDGEQIAYEAGRDTWVINPDGSGQTNITKTPALQEYGVAWSPDGQRIAYLDNTTRLVNTMRVDGTDRRVVAPNLPVQFAPAWQPIPNRGPATQR